ncbi:hypothetical protein [Halobacillus sp. Marseille-P3879]|uniref:hypothetical protein n=1 Tax=Halobacillus TaxID=45667 RepID=UPI000C7C95B5|nr:hypothetical protein [Halobacillus sp. Marseille-P3879]
MKILLVTALGLFLFVSGSLYMIKNSDQYDKVQSEKAQEVQPVEKACEPDEHENTAPEYEETTPLIAEMADGLGEGVRHGFDFILLLFYSFVSSG